MKGTICYYSGSGNTKLASEYIAEKLKNADFSTCNIVRNEIPDLSKYDIVGFATFTDFGDVPKYFYSFFDKINSFPGKNAFVFNTYGMVSGKTLKILENLAKAKQFNVISGYSLHTPESYIPMRVSKMTFDSSPNKKELDKFNRFISALDHTLENIQSGNKAEKSKIRIGILNTIIVKIPRAKDKKDFGIQNVNEERCTQCNICEEKCPYEAIHLDPYPIFDHTRCQGCWACYNHCPEKAIYTKKYKGEGQYPEPGKELISKLA